jgi:hypothetical protein
MGVTMYHFKDQGLLANYITVVRSMSMFRNDPKTYAALDIRRKELHDQLIEVEGKTRTDKKFELILAELLEDIVF